MLGLVLGPVLVAMTHSVLAVYTEGTNDTGTRTVSAATALPAGLKEKDQA